MTSDLSKSLRLLVLANVPGPNLNDFYDELAKRPGIDLEVLYCSHRTKKWKEGIQASAGHRHAFPMNLNPFSNYGRLQINPGAIWRILRGRQDLVMIQGYTTPTLAMALVVCSWLRKPFIYWGEEINRSRSTNPLSVALKGGIVKLIGRARRVFVVGSRGVESYAALGLDPALASPLSYSCDLGPFLAVAEHRAERAPDHDAHAICTTSQLIFRKRVDLLIGAFVALADQYPAWTLNIIGEGELGEQLKASVPGHLKDRVKWWGYLPKAEHPAIHAASEIFVLASREDGGPMSLTEAIASGLPAIATEGVVTAPDLIEDGVSGFIVPRDDGESLTRKLEYLMARHEERRQMGAAAAELGRRADSSAVAERFAIEIRQLG